MLEGLCFVVMGFGKKTDYSGEKPRTLDLDATYEAIIKPAVTQCGLECIRADEVTHSGLIDKPMYELLLRADLVIADISTANPNALYELGVRHALRPYSTIVIKEIDGNFIFDLNHIATLQYKHLGEDIGAREAREKSAALKQRIEAVLAKNEDDSPVYTYLQGLQKPTLSQRELARAVAEVKAQSDTLAQLLEAGRHAAAASQHEEARGYFERALKIQKEARGGGRDATAVEGRPDPYVIQQLAFNTYKSGLPDRVSALESAWKIIEELGPAQSTDPETLGIAGAIQKRLWNARKNREDLEAAIEFYGRGFELKRDYYNGENYAVCLDWRAAVQADPEERAYDRKTAQKVRERIVASLSAAFADPTTRDRSDYKWMLATMANTLYALGRAGGETYEQDFRALRLADWEVRTFEEGKASALALAPKSIPQPGSVQGQA